MLGIKNKELMNLQHTPLVNKVMKQREQIEDIMYFIDEEINELDVNEHLIKLFCL